MDLKFRTLKADEIEVRVGATDKNKKKWVSLLLYKNARVDMDILDETVGKTYWKRRHVRDNANCIVSIYDKDKKEWIEKEDTGSESNTEANKGQASDSFKRACVNWGIGRELYSASKIFVYAKDDDEFNKLKNNTYSVKSITYSIDNKILGLVIVDKSGNVVYQKKSDTVTKAQIIKIQELLKVLGSEFKTHLYEKLDITTSKELSFAKAKDLIGKLEEKVKEKENKEKSKKVINENNE